MKFYLFILLFLSNIAFGLEAKITKMNGEIFLNNKKITTPKKLRPNDLVEAKGKKSFFIVRYSNGSRFLIKNGKLKIQNISLKKNNIQLLRGSIYSYVNPQGKENFSVQTKRAVFGVRGTKFNIEETDEQSYLCVCDGLVEVKKGNESHMAKDNSDVFVTNKMKVGIPSKSMWKNAQEGFKDLGFIIPGRSK